jgi:hypothetical protein
MDRVVEYFEAWFIRTIRDVLNILRTEINCKVSRPLVVLTALAAMRSKKPMNAAPMMRFAE